MTVTFHIYETEEWAPLAVLFSAAGLEVEEGSDPPRKLVKMWRADDEAGQLAGAITLQHRGGVYALGHLAVDPAHNGSGLGESLQEVLFDEVRNLGASEVWSCPRIPEYYVKCGWEIMDPEGAPKVSDCLYCDRFHVSCFPEVIRKSL